jgi:hypothetical protein
MEYWQPLLAKTTAKRSLPQPENVHQRSINSFSCCIFGNQVIALISGLITESLTAIIGQNTIYQRQNNYSKLIYIASCNAYENMTLVVENAILRRYY